MDFNPGFTIKIAANIPNFLGHLEGALNHLKTKGITGVMEELHPGAAGHFGSGAGVGAATGMMGSLMNGDNIWDATKNTALGALSGGVLHTGINHLGAPKAPKAPKAPTPRPAAGGAFE